MTCLYLIFTCWIHILLGKVMKICCATARATLCWWEQKRTKQLPTAAIPRSSQKRHWNWQGRMSIAFWRTNNRSYLDESSNKDVMSVGNILNERENNYYIWLSNDLRVMKTALVCEHNVREIYSDLDTNSYGKSWTIVLGLVSSKIINPSLQRMSPKSKHNESLIENACRAFM